MRNYFRVMLGRKSVHANDCHKDGFIGTDFDLHEDLSRKLPEEWRVFNKTFIPVLLANEPERSKVSAGLACGAIWTVSKGIKRGDIVLSPDGSGSYFVGEVLGDYYYAPGQILPHRRKIQWLNVSIPRAEMSEALQNSTGSIGTVADISSYRTEIESLIGLNPGANPIPHASTDTDIEDPVAFAMEKHLEAFLIQNWNSTELSKEFTIYEEDGEAVGQQFQTDAGSIDILAISKDKKDFLLSNLSVEESATWLWARYCAISGLSKNR